MTDWELQEAELLKKENAYLEKYNWFQKVFDNDLYFPIVLLVMCALGFNIGFLIGLVL